MGRFTNYRNYPIEKVCQLASEPISYYTSSWTWERDGRNPDKRTMAIIHRMANLIYRLETNPISPTLHATDWYLHHAAQHLGGLNSHHLACIQPFGERLFRALQHAKAQAIWLSDQMYQEEIAKIDAMVKFARITIPQMVYGGPTCSGLWRDSSTPEGKLRRFIENYMWQEH